MIFSTQTWSTPASRSRLAYCAGFASPSGWSMRSPSTTPSRTSSSTFTWSASNTSASSIAPPASSPMSKKRRFSPVRQSRSKNFARRAGRARTGWRRRRHVVRHEVEHHVQACRAQGAQLRLAAELLGDGRRIDHVVAVRRALARLHRGRQVEVRDSELAEVRARAAAHLRSRDPARAGAGRWPSPRTAKQHDRERRDLDLTAGRPLVLALGRSGSAVESSSFQREPKRRGGSTKSTGSCPR